MINFWGGLKQQNTVSSPRAIKVNKETPGFFHLDLERGVDRESGILGPDSARSVSTVIIYSTVTIPAKQTEWP